MAKVKITVLRKDFYPELVKEYGVEGFGPCHFEVGQEFICDNHRAPEGMCGEAWKCMQHYVFAFFHNAELPIFPGLWMRKPGVAIVSCNDGLRPVVFKVERVKED